MRSDAELIKHLYFTFGRPTSRNYQNVPLVLLPENAVVALMQSEERIAQEVPTLEYLPWSDAVFDLPAGRDTIVGSSDPLAGRGQMWIRVRRMDDALADLSISSPYLGEGHLTQFQPPENFLFIETWESKTVHEETTEGGRGFPSSPDFSVLPIFNPWSFGKMLHGYPNPECLDLGLRLAGIFCNFAGCRNPTPAISVRCSVSEMLQSASARVACLALAYILSGAAGYAVEVKNNTPVKKESLEKKLRTETPWRRNDLPSIIYLHPDELSKYGHPSGRKEPASQHKSPRPHARRGHWRTLRSERFTEAMRGRRVFVREAWVGETEWISEGQQYKLIIRE